MSKKISFENRNGWLDSFVGTVASVKKWSETKVTGGGHSYIPAGGGGHINTTVHSSVSTKQEFWLVDKNGKESDFALDIPVRDGHKVLIIWGAADGLSQGKYKYWENLTTGECGFTNYNNGDFSDLVLEPNEANQMAKKNKLMLPIFIVCLMTFFMVFPLFIAGFLLYREKKVNADMVKAALRRVEIVKPIIKAYRNEVVAKDTSN
jgi:hypothetical protein